MLAKMRVRLLVKVLVEPRQRSCKEWNHSIAATASVKTLVKLKFNLLVVKHFVKVLKFDRRRSIAWFLF